MMQASVYLSLLGVNIRAGVHQLLYQKRDGEIIRKRLCTCLASLSGSALAAQAGLDNGRGRTFKLVECEVASGAPQNRSANVLLADSRDLEWWLSLFKYQMRFACGHVQNGLREHRVCPGEPCPCIQLVSSENRYICDSHLRVTSLALCTFTASLTNPSLLTSRTSFKDLVISSSSSLVMA